MNDVIQLLVVILQIKTPDNFFFTSLKHFLQSSFQLRGLMYRHLDGIFIHIRCSSL